MGEHTPTPWTTNGGMIGDSEGRYIAELSSPRGSDQRDTDQAFIVKAVNNHDALVKALESIAGWRKIDIRGEYLHSLRDIIRSITDCAAAALDKAASTPDHGEGG